MMSVIGYGLFVVWKIEKLTMRRVDFTDIFPMFGNVTKKVMFSLD